MKVIKRNDAEEGQNTSECVTIEYSFGDLDIDLGIAHISGRFPKKGFCANLECKELIYVLEGNAQITFDNNKTINLSKGDSILIYPNEKYYWNSTNCTLSMSCNPAWPREQHKIFD